jgi:hypothetical protein
VSDREQQAVELKEQVHDALNGLAALAVVYAEEGRESALASLLFCTTSDVKVLAALLERVGADPINPAHDPLWDRDWFRAIAKAEDPVDALADARDGQWNAQTIREQTGQIRHRTPALYSGGASVARWDDSGIELHPDAEVPPLGPGDRVSVSIKPRSE